MSVSKADLERYSSGYGIFSEMARDLIAERNKNSNWRRVIKEWSQCTEGPDGQACSGCCEEVDKLLGLQGRSKRPGNYEKRRLSLDERTADWVKCAHLCEKHWIWSHRVQPNKPCHLSAFQDCGACVEYPTGLGEPLIKVEYANTSQCVRD